MSTTKETEKKLSPKQEAAKRLLKLIEGKRDFGWEDYADDRPVTPGRQRAWENRESKIHEQTVKLTEGIQARLQNILRNKD